MSPLINGFISGLLLQLAIGPVFFFILGITIDSAFTNSVSAIIAVTIVDYIYIALSIFGIGRALESTPSRRIFGTISSLLIFLFGIISVKNGLTAIHGNVIQNVAHWTPFNSFLSCFLLTISSPLTIVFWGSIFTGKAIEMGYQKEELIRFGIGAGFATFVFLSISMLLISTFKTNIPAVIIQFLNCGVGAVLMYYGITRVMKLAATR